MPIIGQVGRKSLKLKMLNAGIHLILIVGSATMLYPFMIMLSGSFMSNVDSRQLGVLPKYFINDEALFQKYIEARYNESTALLARNYVGRFLSFDQIKLPHNPNKQKWTDWKDYLNDHASVHGLFDYQISEQFGRGVYPRNDRAFRETIKTECDGDISVYNTKYNASCDTWDEVSVFEPNVLSRRFDGDYHGILKRYLAFRGQLPLWHRLYLSLDGDYVETELKPSYANSLSSLNASLGTHFKKWQDIALQATVPPGKIKKHWLRYVRSSLNLHHIDVDDTALPAYRMFLKDQYKDISVLNKVYDSEYKTFDSILFPDLLNVSGISLSDWGNFIENVVDPACLKVRGVDFDYRRWLKLKYKTLANINRAWDVHYSDWLEIRIDNWNNDYFNFIGHRKSIMHEFVVRNYIMVLDLMLYNGRAMLNTLIYCLLAIFTALLVNPLAAYAMSRFKLAATYKILLFLMLTMAFPPMVMGIPNFILLKKLNLLNTFWALVLPAAADGYFIFLLKGFFDSQPRELYECATLDGASEWSIFWNIAMALSKPIMAVIALGAFNAAYRNFMLAFIVCQDKSMWTMMVHIYQLIQRSGMGVGFAALVIASIPTFLVFVVCQNVIIKGIVVPTEK